MKLILALVYSLLFAAPALAQAGGMIAGDYEVVGMSTNSEGQILVLMRIKGKGTTLCVINKPELVTVASTSVSTRKCFIVH